MKRTVIALALSALIAGPAAAAEGWGIAHEKVVRYEAKVVDLVCELTGDCPDNCGGGKRQLGLVKEDGTLYPLVKGQDIFANAVPDLLPFCGRKVIADGLEINNPKMHLFMLQFRKGTGEDAKWRRANAFGREWAEKHGKPAEQWFRHDPMIVKTIAEQGKLGDPKLKLEE